jgi:hypothetical protein
MQVIFIIAYLKEITNFNGLSKPLASINLQVFNSLKVGSLRAYYKNLS